MKKNIYILFLTLVVIMLFLSYGQSTVYAESWKPYDRQAAVAYAQKWAKSYNPVWGNYSTANSGGGGDCTNFVSQVLYAGGIPEDKSGSAQWYWDNGKPPSVSSSRSASWTGVNELYNYIKTNTSGNGWRGPQGNVYASRKDMKIGDIIQIDFGKNGTWDHSVVVTKTWTTGFLWWKKYNILVSYHTTNTLDKNLDNITNANFRYISIKGSRIP